MVDPGGTDDRLDTSTVPDGHDNDPKPGVATIARHVAPQQAVAESLSQILAEHFPALADAVRRAHAKGSITIKIELDYVSESAEKTKLTVTPKLALPGAGVFFTGRIKVDRGKSQLELFSRIGEVA